jgi:membrane fusion protein (multidrug efflux system)
MNTGIQNKKRVSITATILFLFVLTALISCGKKEDKNKTQNPQGPPVMAVDGMIATPAPLENKITSTGTLLPNEEIELRPEISGRIIGIYFEEGAKVKKGQLLAKINDSDLQAQLKKLELQESLLKDRERRSKALYEKEGVSAEEYETALNNLKTTQAEMELIRSQLDKTRISAPFDGILGLRYASQGGYVTSSNLIATLQQLDPIKLEFTVPEKYASDIKEGTRIEFSVEGSEQTYKATVYAMESAVDVNTRTVRFRAKGPNPNNILKPGAFAKVGIIVNVIPNALLVPSQAVVPVMQGFKLFVVKNGRAFSAPVETGIRTERDIEITEGISPQDTIIISGLMSLKDSVQVSIKSFKEGKVATR